MTLMHPLDEIIRLQKEGQARGITSICSANPTVLEAAMEFALQRGDHVLIESTCNQVNQFGGYTGMTPADFVAYLRAMADRSGFPWERLILGGDHLGPEVWQAEPADSAMGKARVLVRDCVRAGYLKIHLDASMKLGDDPKDAPLDKEILAARAADLARVAEAAHQGRGEGFPAPRYVIGTEVPLPGGAHEKEDHIEVTTVRDVQETIEVSRQAFERSGLEVAWERVIAVVVQPGVEYGDDFVIPYDRGQASELSRYIETQPLVYEAHSTDYQTRGALRKLVEDYFAILKVGPALTFAYREAIFALAMIEEEWLGGRPGVELSRIRQILEEVMLSRPKYWRKYYQGTPDQQCLARKYSYSDRVRYYWPDPAVKSGLERLFDNLSKGGVPLSLLSQFMPHQYARVRAGEIAPNPLAVTRDKVRSVLEDYCYAVQGSME
jgi:D-tagatose-1,6-bisphosphate aldolase subunit GatZ/KbaZ